MKLCVIFKENQLESFVLAVNHAVIIYPFAVHMLVMVVLLQQNVILIFAVIVRFMAVVSKYGERWYQNETIKF